MKKIILFAIITLILAGAASALQQQSIPYKPTGLTDLRISVLKYEPAPATPGNYVDIWLSMSNKGQDISNVVLSITPEYPFSLGTGQEQLVSVGDIPALKDAVVKIRANVELGAPNDIKNLTVQHTYGKGEAWSKFEIPIQIQTQDAGLTIDEYSINPKDVAPGTEAILTMKIKNNGRIAVKNVDISLDLTGENSKLSTIGSGTKKRILSIPAGESQDVEFDVIADTDALVKVYSVPVAFNYQDERGQKYTDSSSLSILVNDKPNLAMNVESTTIQSIRSVGEVDLKVINKGIVNVKYLTVTLKESPDYNILSTSSETYIGNLDSDDFETISFIIKPKSKITSLKAEAEFRDAYNKPYTVQYSIPLRIITASELGQGPNYFMYIAFLGLIGGGIYWWHKRRNKKRA